MLPKPYRIPKTDFSEVFKNGVRQHTPYFQFVTKQNKTTQSRFGIIIGKRISKSAVCRNRIKRMARDAFQSLQTNIHPPLDIVCIVKQDCSMEKSVDVKQQMKIALHQTDKKS